MDSYSEFAYLYDTFMEDVPYEKWADLLSSLLKAYGENVRTVVDLGCGTGTLTELMASRGFEMTGIDLSEDMLSVAAMKNSESDNDIFYINQDMRTFEMLEKTDAVISICDSINYMIMDEDIQSCFAHVRDCIKKGGLFIFDFNTVYKYETVIGDATIAENREDASFIWENYYCSEDHINEYDVTFFSRVAPDECQELGIGDEIFRRFTETHIQRGYSLEEMKKFVAEAGFKFITALDEASLKEPDEESERIYIIARRA